MLIGITGAAGAGKNTVANILSDKYGFEQVAFADALKESLVALDPLVLINGSTERLSDIVERESMDVAKNKYPSVRKALQDYGVAMRDCVDKDVWVKMVHQTIQNSSSGKVCITDLRFENELKYIMDMNGAVIKVVRPDNPFDIGSTHVSEKMVVDTPYVIENNVATLNELGLLIESKWEEWNFKQGYQKRYKANGRAFCKTCDESKSLDEFPPDNRMAIGVSSTCRSCTNLKAKHKPSRSPEARKLEYDSLNKDLLFRQSREKLLASYGLSVSDYDRMLAEQGGVCAICGRPENRTHHVTGRAFNLSVDHDHETGKVRGLLCTRCNKAVGALGDSHESIQRVVEYLKPWGSKEGD